MKGVRHLYRKLPASL